VSEASTGVRNQRAVVRNIRVATGHGGYVDASESK